MTASILLPDRPQISRWDVPDAAFAVDNEWDVTTLDLAMQASYVHLPVVAWGSVKRNQVMRGTWHFYVDDYRSSALVKDPSPIVNSQCVAACEINFTTSEQCQRWYALQTVGQKRYIGRWLQSQGIRLFVDLNVAPRWYDLNMMGVPRGWKAYMTRGYTDRLDWTEIEYQMAVERAETTEILFAVYGGARAVRERCMERGWIHIPECMDARKGKADG